jgi:hypothetical protein
MNTMSDKNFKIAFVVICLKFMWTLLRLNIKNDQLKEKTIELQVVANQKDSLKKLSDSLSMELFPLEIELGRYQVAYEIFLERNPKAASQYGDIISNETE